MSGTKRAHGYDLARRSVLGGFFAVAALTPAERVFPKDDLRVGDLVASGAASPRARALSGATVTLRGYLAQSLDGGPDYLLSESPIGVCQLCGAFHDPDIALRVEAADGAALPASGVALIEATGRIAMQGTDVRLLDARIVAI